LIRCPWPLELFFLRVVFERCVFPFQCKPLRLHVDLSALASLLPLQFPLHHISVKLFVLFLSKVSIPGFLKAVGHGEERGPSQ